MEIKDLIEGEYYYEEYRNKSYISKSGKGNKSKYYISPECRTFETNGIITSSILKLRLATPLERKHLDLCILEGRYIDFPKEVNLIEELIL